MRQYLKITTIVAGAHFVLCSAIFTWYFGVLHRVEGDPLFWHFLEKILLIVHPLGHMYRGKGDAILTFALNSAIWGAGIGLLIYAITSRFQKRTA